MKIRFHRHIEILIKHYIIIRWYYIFFAWLSLWAAEQQFTVNDVSASSGISLLRRAAYSILNHLWDVDLCKKMFDFYIFSSFQIFHSRFIIRTDFTHIASSGVVIDDVTN